MRLLSIAIGVVVAFGVGVWGISRTLPEAAPAWIGITLCMLWLFGLVFGASLLSSKERKNVRDQVRLLDYGLLAALLISSVLTPLFIYKVKVPRWACEVIIGVICGAGFLLSRYAEQ